MMENKAFWVSALATILIWGAYPAVLARADFADAFLGAVLAICAAALGWGVMVLLQRPDLGAIWRGARGAKGALALSGLFFAIEVACFVPAVARSPETAAVLFEIWVISFVVTSFLRDPASRLGRKDWVFFFFGFCGASIAVVDLANLERTDLALLDPVAIALAVFAAIAMGVKTYMNSEISQRFVGLPAFAASALPHFLSALVAVPIWVALLWLTGDLSLPVYEPGVAEGILSVGATYWLGVPVFIYAVRLRPNDGVMAVFYVIPMVALLFLAAFGVASLQVYFIIGASIIFISNAMLTQPLPYVSASGVAAVLTLMVSWLAISIEQGHLGRFMEVSNEGPGISAAEAFMVFYGLIFAFVLGDILNDLKAVRSALYRGLGQARLETWSLPALRRAYLALWRQIHTGRPVFQRRTSVGEEDTRLQSLLVEFASQSLQSIVSSTPYGIFRILSVGFLALVFVAYCISPILLDRLVGLLLFALVCYFLFYTRETYMRGVVMPSILEEALESFRPERYTTKAAKRRGSHRLGLVLLVFALMLGGALNIFIEWRP